jgi:zinc transporter ZupT
MTPVVQLYWVRVSLGLVAALVTSILAHFVFFGNDFTPLLNSITVALLIYFITYYILKPIYKDKIEKQSKILSTGIGMYFFTWIAFFVLFYTILQVYIPLT